MGACMFATSAHVESVRAFRAGVDDEGEAMLVASGVVGHGVKRWSRQIACPS